MDKKSNFLLTLSIILATVVILLSCFVVYDKFLRNDPVSTCISKDTETTASTCNCPKCQECEKCDDSRPASGSGCASVAGVSSNLGEKITNLKEIKVTNVNQDIKIGGNTYKIRVGTDTEYGQLAVNDRFVSAGAYHAYLTDKYALFTNMGQDGDVLNYAIGEKGKIVVNDNDYQIDENSFKMVDGYLHASGHIWCGLDPENPEPRCLNHDIIIKFIDNTLIVTEVK